MDRKDGRLGFRGQIPVQQVYNTSVVTIDKVLDMKPLDAFASGQFLDLPIMAGSVRDEGSLPVGLMYRDYLIPNGRNSSDYEFMKDDIVQAVMASFGLSEGTGALKNSMQLAYFPHYMPLGNFSQMVGGLIDMTSVMFLKSGSLRTMNTLLTNKNY